MYLQRFLLLFFIVFGMSAFGNEFTKQATNKPVLVQTGAQKEWCPVCGMKLAAFYKTSHAATLPNGKMEQYCSIRCLAVAMQEYTIAHNTIEVVDAKTEKLIKAASAHYVVGSEIPGTMSKTSKLAFKEIKDATEFAKKHGGTIVSFSDALQSAQDSLRGDIAMVQMKKEKKIYPMGKNIFEKKCDDSIDLGLYININELKADLQHKKPCGDLAEPQLQPLALYLWEQKRFEDIKNLGDAIEVAKDEKCPVCGMFVHKYPRWAAQIFYKEEHLSFDGVKDMMKFYFEPHLFSKNYTKTSAIDKILVTDYYTQKAIDATSAHYVIGSDTYGPMGHELIPFKNLEDAKTFYIDHKGGKILEFNQLTKEDIYKLDQ